MGTTRARLIFDPRRGTALYVSGLGGKRNGRSFARADGISGKWTAVADAFWRRRAALGPGGEFLEDATEFLRKKLIGLGLGTEESLAGLTPENAGAVMRRPWMGVEGAERARRATIGIRRATGKDFAATAVAEPDLFRALERIAPGMPKSKRALATVRRNPASVVLWIAMRRLGFRKPDSWYAVADAWADRAEKDGDWRGRATGGWEAMADSPEATVFALAECGVRFTRRAIALRGENAVRRELFRVGEWEARDLARMVADLRRRLGDRFGEFWPKAPEAMRWSDAHDEAARLRLRLRLRNANAALPRGERREALEGEFGGLSFRVPPDKRALAAAGKEFGNCVYSYAEDVLAERTTIVVARGVDGTAEACLQLDASLKRVVQAKGRFNAYLRGKTAGAVLEWIGAKGLKKDSTDFGRMDASDGAKEEFAYGERRFDRVGPDDVIDVGDAFGA